MTILGIVAVIAFAVFIVIQLRTETKIPPVAPSPYPTKFKDGDRVEVVVSDDRLEFGGIYTISGMFGSTVTLQEVSGTFNSDIFQLV